MEHLPQELIENILSQGDLTIQDVVNFSSTNKTFRASVLENSVLWRKKFHYNWPKAVPFFDKSYSDFFDEIQYIFYVKKYMMALLEQMPQRFYNKYQLSDTDLEEWVSLVSQKPQTFYYCVGYLLEIISIDENIKSIEVIPLNTPGNKTLQYYAAKVLRYLKQCHLKNVWAEYARLSSKYQTLERGAIFVAQWCQPELDIDEAAIQKQLDSIANQVLDSVRNSCPDHPVLRASKQQRAEWKNGNLDKCEWSVPECRQLIVALRDVLYTDIGFSGNREHYYMSDNSLINKVLETKRGLPIILAIIYESVGRRLGLLFEPINFPAHFLLRFTECDSRKATVYYIDTFNGGDVMQKTGCPYSSAVPREVLFPVASAVQVVERIVNNLELSTRQYVRHDGRVTFLRAILELLILVSPLDLTAAMSIAKLYTMHRINTKSLEEYLTSQTFNSPDQVEAVLAMIRGFPSHHTHIECELDIQHADIQQRTEDIIYAVGMIMTDITRNDQCVIYGWNITYGARVCGQKYYQTLDRKRHCFYNVLVEDGSYRYVPQDSLVHTSYGGALHSVKDIGRYFSHFFENHFVPNAQKEAEYPFDTKVRHHFYQKMHLNNYKP